MRTKPITGRVWKRGRHYYAEWTRNGERHRLALDTGDRREADAALRELLASDSLAHPAGSRAGTGAATALEKAWAAYAAPERAPDVAESTMERYRAQWREFREWLRDQRPRATTLRDVRREDAAEYLAQMEARGLSAGTRNKRLVLLRAVWRAAAPGMPTPWDGIRRRREEPQSRRELTVEELRRVAALARGEMRTLIAVGVYTGLRLGDAATLDWGRVDLVRGHIQMPPRKTARHGTWVRVPIPGALAAVLEDVPAARRRGPVMPGVAEDYAADPRKITDAVQGLFERAGIATHAPGTGAGTGRRARVVVGFHSLRHTYVSICANAGVPMAVVQAIVGHSNAAMTRHYFHVADDALDAAARALPDVAGTGESPALARFRAAAAALAPGDMAAAAEIWARLAGERRRERRRRGWEDA